MHFENFTERDIPYGTLANYGLTHEMITKFFAVVSFVTWATAFLNLSETILL